MIPGAIRKTHPSLSEIAERMPKWWRTQPSRRAKHCPFLFAWRESASPSLRCSSRAVWITNYIAYEKYSRFIRILFYMILTKGYRYTFCALLCGISGTNLILYYLHGSFYKIAIIHVCEIFLIFQHHVSIFIILLNDLYLNKCW